MKLLNLCIFLLLMGTSVMSAQSGKALVIEKNNGQKSYFILAQKPEVSFSNHVLHLYMNGNYSDFELSNVSRFFFVDASLGIEDKQTEKGLKISYLSNDKVCIENMENTDKVKLYSLDGVEYPNSIHIINHSVEIPLGSLPKGTYIINISNKQSFKINRK